MLRASRQAGQPIRKLALKRRIKAIALFASAGFLFLVPLLGGKIFERIFNPVASIDIQSETWLKPLFPILLGSALSLIATGVFLWKRANHADQGAKGEEDVAQELIQLENEGWQIEYNLYLTNGMGDADVVCISPRRKAYVVDVKAHRGEIATDGHRLYRRLGRKNYAFKKNLLQQAIMQAIQVRKQQRLSFVTPIVVFANATVLIPIGNQRKVYVVEKSKLVSLLRSLG